MAKEKKSTIYLVWSRTTTLTGMPSVSLRAVDTKKSIANRHVKMIKQSEPRIVHVWSEKSLTNHCYGHNDVVVADICRRG